MLRWYHNLSIKYKIFIPFCLALMLFSAACYWYGVKEAQNTMMNNVGTSNTLILEQISKNFSFVRREVEDMSTQLIIQPTIQEYLQPVSSSSDSGEKLYVNLNVRNAVNQIATKEYIAQLAIVGFHNNTVPLLRGIDAKFAVPGRDVLEESPVYQRAMKAGGKPVWTDWREDIALFTSDASACLMMARLIKDYNTYTDLGIMLVVIHQRGMRTIYTQALDSDEGGILLWNSREELMSSYGTGLPTGAENLAYDAEQTMNKWYRVLTLDRQSYLFSYAVDEDMGWRYAYGVPMSTLVETLNMSARYWIPFILVAAGIFVFAFSLCTDMIIRPAKKLLDAMERFQMGDFEAHIDFRYQDEIGRLGKGFNDMVTHIRELISRVYVLKIKEREAELTALQSQINPHFLYNTLDAIYWKAERNQEGEIGEMVLRLSNLFRMSLNKGKRFNPVREEFQFLEQYLHLQKLRYGSKIDYTIHLDQDAGEVEIPKLVLQPFVENAVYHGLEQKKSKGMVWVDCRIVQEMLEVTIRDDGAGMEQTLARELESGEVRMKSHMGGYAIHNVRERLQLVYGDAFSIRVNSRLNCGTTVRLLLPTTHPVLEETL